MFRRMLPLILALCLCLGTAAAQTDAETLIAQALYLIVHRSEAGDVPLGSGVIFQDRQMLLTAESCWAEGTIVAVGRDGEHAVTSRLPAGDSGAVLLTLAEPSAAQPLGFSDLTVQSLPYVFGANAEGRLGAVPLYQALHGWFRDSSAMQLAAEEGLLPGAVMMDEKAGLLGLVLARHTDGRGTYTALDPDVLRMALTGAQGSYLPLDMRWDEGVLTVAWQDEPRTEGLYLLTISGMGNRYYTTFEVQAPASSIELMVPPGHTYHIQVQWTPDADSAKKADWAAAAPYTIPALPYTAYAFRQECALAGVPRGKPAEGVLPELAFVSVDTLAAGNALYLQATNRYDVSGEIELPMTVELIGPDGQFFFRDMLCLLSPEKEDGDVFTVPVDELFASCRSFSPGQALQPGSYVLRCAIAGRTAGEYAFTVHPAGTVTPQAPAQDGPAQTQPAPAADTGLLTGLQAECSKGVIHLAWPAEQVPEGASVTACILYGGNGYFTYYTVKPGTTAVDFYAVPGRDCMLWAGWTARDGDVPPFPEAEEEYVLLPPGQVKPFTDFDFMHVRGDLTMTAHAQPETQTAFLQGGAITREALQDPALKLVYQTEDTYRCDAESSNHPLTFVLGTPEGYAFVEEGYYSFLPEYSACDFWVKDLSALAQEYAGAAGDAAWPAGVYTLGYYIDGLFVEEIRFILEE